ncbi:MAG: nucleotidyltransferase family protein [Desulfofustis sp.]|jgi:glucose-1-phosphate thymidylyltransferase|nr:nucleotidyltransferase family protein [Desulfofustis sp.]
MNAVLLCAGFATRMYPLTRNFPKPLLPVAGQPVIDYLMDQLSALGSIDAVHLVSNRRFFDHFLRWRENHIERGTYRRLRIEIYDDGCTDNETRLGASGDLMLALHMIGTPDKILVSGGDNIYRFALAPLWKSFLRGSGHRITAIEETDAARLKQTGVLEFGESDRVVRLHEKAAQPPSNWTCPPLYFFQPSVWKELERFLNTSNNHDAPGHLIDFLCVHSRVEAFRIDGDRLDIGSIETYRQADELLAKQFN